MLIELGLHSYAVAILRVLQDEHEKVMIVVLFMTGAKRVAESKKRPVSRGNDEDNSGDHTGFT